MHIDISFSWWWFLWAFLAIWGIGTFAAFWLTCAVAGRSCLTWKDSLAYLFWPFLPIIGFFSVFWN